MRELTRYTREVDEVTAIEAVRFMSDALSGQIGSNVAQRQRTAGDLAGPASAAAAWAGWSAADPAIPGVDLSTAV